MEQRRTKRFKLELPLSITRSGAERVALIGCTRNISSSGVLFTTQREPDLGGSIEYIITLNRDGPQSVHLRCMGKVLRTDCLGADRDHPDQPEENDRQALNFLIAATLERFEFVRERGAAG